MTISALTILEAIEAVHIALADGCAVSAKVFLDYAFDKIEEQRAGGYWSQWHAAAQEVAAA